ncbi:MAG: tRNA adenosine(34) deaminase TadA [Gammaproteobacteria bacterium]|nr:tRNA adenosine(34) deaminase TadA [Gammaproteobacteria bacterium]
MGIADRDVHWMNLALEHARTAASHDEIPVGAVLVASGKVLGQGYNAALASADCTAHAEIQALRAAGKATGNYRFPEATLYCTLEPCAMCLGALLHARVERLVYAAEDPRSGAAGSVVDLTDVPEFNHRLIVTSGVMAAEAAHLLRDYFRAKR